MTSPQRAKALPDLPTLSEAGVPGFDLINWYGLFAPAGTPRAIVAVLHRDVTQALNSSDVQAMFAKDGAEAAPSDSPEEFKGLLAKDLDMWEKIIRTMSSFADSLR